ncbi:MAG: ATP-dependent metallopeptidase FtsH/Yme1/Tma family protein [Alphaproteobacteria bacterium]|nr:ATP-dependent metallopeptidase FtsH/Yme1/Tma family protein [Alphaproteobacteria bacterium]
MWLAFGLALIWAVQIFSGSERRSDVQRVSFTEFVSAVERGEVRSVTLSGDSARAAVGNRTIETYVPEEAGLTALLRQNKVDITVTPPPRPSFLSQLVLALLPMLLFIGVWVWLSRQAQNGLGGIGRFAKSRAKMLKPDQTRVTFADVAGIDEAKQELQEIVEFLRDPAKFERLGGRMPKGVLLVGSPGTGKTLTAKAVAGEANVPFFSISGSDFVEMFVGVGASRVRDMFEEAKKNAPCIIFIDEIDAVGRHRGAGMGGGHDEREQTLNQLLVEMDGFETGIGIIIIAATNRPDVLDPALLRPGRFDRQVVVPIPDVRGRQQILDVHARRLPLKADVDLKTIARGTPGFSGADLANLVNEAALLAARRNLAQVGQAEFDDAKDKVMMGAERRSMVMTDADRRLTAYHEAGHAVVAFHEPESDPIHKATIVPRGRALGMVLRLPEGDRLSIAVDKLQADLAVAMGGRVAEELVFGKHKITTGASSDIRMATELARRMVTEWGMSESLGPVMYGDGQQEVFLGRSFAQSRNVSEATAQRIDEEVKRIVNGGNERARSSLSTHRDQLELLARALLEHETLDGAEIKHLLTTGEMPPTPAAPPSPPPVSGGGASNRPRSSVPVSRPAIAPN